MTEEVFHVHDIIIIGAGPCGLSLAARLHESTPSALFTDSEHQRYHWMRSSPISRQTSKPTKVSRRSNTAQDRLLSGPSLPGPLDIAVLDAHSDSWMSAWDKKFKDLKISHLRSPMFFHPDPRDRDGLLEFAHRDGVPEKGVLKEIKDVVGKDLSKHQRKKKVKNGGKSQQQETTYLDERDRHDYFRPSQKLFGAYCTSIIDRYDLSSIVQKCEVVNITYDSSTSIFTLLTSTGQIKYSKIVVLATGATSKPTLPPNNPFTSPPGKNKNARGSVSHAFSPSGIIPTSLKTKTSSGKQTSLAVIGGGLTSAQVSSLAISSGVSKVYHFTRGTLKTKHFDVDLSWVGKYKNFHLAAFWGAEGDEERFEMIKEARGGGSVNPEYKSLLVDLGKKGKVSVCENTEVVGAIWDEEGRKWKLETEPKTEGLGCVDHVVYATGVVADVGSVPFMQDLMREREVKTVGGMPCLTHDLMWDEETPLFVTGRLAGLRLGPGAGNLEGARQGAERIAWKVGELLKSGMERRDSGYGSEAEVDMRRIGLGLNNQFSVFSEGELSGED